MPAAAPQYDYQDSYSSPALGTLTASSGTATLAHGATGTISGTVTAQSAPVAGRKLAGELAVVTNEGAVVGRGTVSIGAVN